MRRNPWIAALVLLCGILLCGRTRAQEDLLNNRRCPETAATTCTNLPLRIYRNFLMVAEGQFGGGGEPHNFVLDTGTAPSIIDTTIVKKLGLATYASVMTAIGKVMPTQAAILPELDLGPIRAVSLPVQIEDLSRLKRDLGIPVAGILGLDVLAQSSFRLDYEKKLLSFGETADKGIPVSFDARVGLAMASVKLEGKPARMLVDTGTDRVVLLGGGLRGTAGLALRNTSQTGSSLVDRAMGVKVFYAPDIVLDEKHFTVEKAYFVPGDANPGFDGLIGVRALGFRALAYSRARGAIYLQK